MILLLTSFCIFGLVIIYFKFKRDEKKKKGSKAEIQQTDTVDIDQLINDYPTYTRNKK